MAPRTPDGAAAAMDTAPADPPPPQILVAEDNDINRKVILLQLRLIGLPAQVAHNGVEALACWRTGEFALLLTDLHMPQMDGFALASAIRADEAGGRRRPIVAVTANAQHEQDARCRAAGIDACLTKPVRLAQLRATIEQWLGPLPGTVGSHEGAPPAMEPPAPADLRVLAKLVGNTPSVLNDVLQSFVQSSHLAGVRMHEATALGATASVAAAAHRLKSAARAIGALHLGDICDQIELAAGTGSAANAPDLMRLLQSFSTEQQAVHRFIESRPGAGAS